MPLQRYLLVEGVLDEHGNGLPVTNPHQPELRTGNTARYVGWRLRPTIHPDPITLLENYEPAPEVIVDHPDLRRAAKRGHLRILGEAAERSHAEAAAKLAVHQQKHAIKTKAQKEEGGSK